jgi:hypothetical protein
MAFFNKKNKKNSNETLQSLQQEFNQTLFELGDLNYRKHMMNEELAKINSEINKRVQAGDEMGKRAAVLRAKAQEELAARVKEGQPLLKVADEPKNDNKVD